MNYEQELAQKCKRNPKFLYYYVNRQKTFKDKIVKLFDKNNQELLDGRQIANCLNEQFFEVFNRDPECANVEFVNRTEVKFELNLSVFCEEKIYSTLKKLEKFKTPGTDGIHPFVLNKCPKVLSRFFQFCLKNHSVKVKYHKIGKRLTFVLCTKNPVKSAISIHTDGPASNVRGHKHRLERQLIRNCEQRHNFFSNRIVPKWNRLSDQTIKAKSTNCLDTVEK
ncbi:unnamed protein product [Brachionus calyciflorus]|uniref:Uncharacterized protein n=1 Tax=Brachionus calyciflorus TaxID=104777 RepID=A0A813M428_9BILA|nr:unnamed protein product [Brachionus calyciflorus]